MIGLIPQRTCQDTATNAHLNGAIPENHMRCLSKSKIMAGLQCPKRLYLEVHHPELLAFSEHTQRSFGIGNEVGEAARAQHPGGRLIEQQDDLKLALEQTQHLLEESGDVTLFEPAFQHGRTLVRADIFSRNRKVYRLVEVKASTTLKPHYVNDVAIQSWVIEGAGYPLKTAHLAHIDTSFVYSGGGDYRGLFAAHDLTEVIEPLIQEVPSLVADMQTILRGAEPDIAVGPQCTDPYECPFLSHCSPAESEYPVTILPYGGKLTRTLIAEGYADLRDVPGERLTKEDHQRVWRASKTGKTEFSAELASELRALRYPRFYLDFETIQFPVPIWVGTRPYEQLPFQWSCHIETADGRLTHKEFLNASAQAPMRAFAESLIATLGTKGPVLVYSHFERTQLKALIARFPDLDVPLTRIIKRLFDLLPVAQAAYYHPAMKGSWSIKAVLPTIAPELDYGTLGEVQHGGDAQAVYREVIHPATAPERRAALSQDLKSYCALDTLALVRVARHFEGRDET